MSARHATDTVILPGTLPSLTLCPLNVASAIGDGILEPTGWTNVCVASGNVIVVRWRHDGRGGGRGPGVAVLCGVSAADVGDAS